MPKRIPHPKIPRTKDELMSRSDEVRAELEEKSSDGWTYVVRRSRVTDEIPVWVGRFRDPRASSLISESQKMVGNLWWPIDENLKRQAGQGELSKWHPSIGLLEQHVLRSIAVFGLNVTGGIAQGLRLMTAHTLCHGPWEDEDLVWFSIDTIRNLKLDSFDWESVEHKTFSYEKAATKFFNESVNADIKSYFKDPDVLHEFMLSEIVKTHEDFRDVILNEHERLQKAIAEARERELRKPTENLNDTDFARIFKHHMGKS